VDHAGLILAGDVEIRRARPDELQACADLYVHVLSETFTWLAPERHDRAEFLRAARDEEIYVAVSDEGVIGVAAFLRPMNFLHSLYVTRRGQGVGKRLLDHVAAQANGPLSLKVQEQNRRAQAFYAREGFVATQRGRDPGSDIVWIRLMREKPESR
jgi:GNAT superfamily N-acetyltransferase